MRFKCRSDTIILTIAVIIAALSLIFTTWQSSKTYQLTRQHNQLSVTPHLDILKHQTAHMPRGISVINNGIGPAKIIKFEVFLDGQKMPDAFAWWEAILKITKKEFGDWKGQISFGRVRQGQFVREGKEIFLLQEPPGQNTQEAQTVFNNLKNRLGFIIKYESIYGESFEVKRIQNINKKL